MRTALAIGAIRAVLGTAAADELPMVTCSEPQMPCHVDRNRDPTPEEHANIVREREAENRKIAEERAGICNPQPDKSLHCINRLPKDR